jgi:hypothetical protein
VGRNDAPPRDLSYEPCFSCVLWHPSWPAVDVPMHTNTGTEVSSNPKIVATSLWWLGGRGEGDGVAEGFELADVVALLPVWVEVSGEMVGPEIGESGVVVAE